jgi:hypothetical protein
VGADTQSRGIEPAGAPPLYAGECGNLDEVPALSTNSQQHYCRRYTMATAIMQDLSRKADILREQKRRVEAQQELIILRKEGY